MTILIKASNSLIGIYKAIGYTQITYSTNDQKFHRSKLLLFYSIILLSAISIWFLYGLLNLKEKRFLLDSYVNHAIDIVHIAGAGSGYIISVLEVLRQRGKQLAFFEKLKEVDELFTNALRIDTGRERAQKSILIRLCFIISLYILIQCYFMASLYHFKSSTYVHDVLLYTVLLILCSLRFIEAYGYVTGLKNRFDKVNECLHSMPELNDKTALFEKPETRKFGFYQTEAFLQKSNLEHKWQFQLSTLRKIYHQLWDLTGIHNDIFGISMLVNIGNSFLSVMVTAYGVFLATAEKKFTTENLYIFSGFVLSLVPHTLNLILISRACYLAGQSANQSSVLVHKMATDVTNKNHNICVEQFSLQLLQQKITFGAYSFFNIDLSLLYTIAGAITTYLVILIQFHMSSQSS